MDLHAVVPLHVNHITHKRRIHKIDLQLEHCKDNYKFTQWTANKPNLDLLTATVLDLAISLLRSYSYYHFLGKLQSMHDCANIIHHRSTI